MNIGEKIKKLRNEKAMTQSELAGSFITRNMLSLIESGTAQPSLPTIRYLAEKLNVPAGILIEDDKYEYFYKRVLAIENIRTAFCAENHRICLDLCEKTDEEENDPEINLIRAECHLEIAKEDFADGFLKNACYNFDRACDFAEKTVYNTDRIFAEAKVYCNYMRDLSTSLFAECAERNALTEMAFSDEFCRYVKCIEDGFDGSSLAFENLIYGEHIKAKNYYKIGEYRSAYDLMFKILNSDQSVPKPIIYDIFKDLEVCCRELGDFKGAYEYSGNKVVMLERLLAGDTLL